MPRGCVLTIGHFDGVHIGHRAILRDARRAADSGGGLPVVAITFARHPSSTLRPGSEPPRLLRTDDKVARLREAGADRVVILDPTPELLSHTPERFIRDIVEEHAPVHVFEGEDFRFGKDRAGDTDTLGSLGDRFGFAMHVLRKTRVTLGDQLVAPCSSSLIRWLVGRGRVEDAARCLTRPFSLTGRVVRGQQQARLLGTPTANLDPADYAGFIVPTDGVYAGFLTIHHADSAERGDQGPGAADLPPRSYPAAISVGIKPTLGRHELTIEAHALDLPPADADLYGQTVTVTFTRWLRDQFTYPALDPLVAQIHRDVERVRRLHQQGLLTPPTVFPNPPDLLSESAATLAV